LLAVARLADDDPWRQQLRDPAVRQNRQALERLAQEKGILSQSPASLVLLSFFLDKANSQAAAIRLLRNAQRAHPDDLWIKSSPGRSLGRGSRDPG
jgi:hypothetical protein